MYNVFQTKGWPNEKVSWISHAHRQPGELENFSKMFVLFFKQGNGPGGIRDRPRLYLFHRQIQASAQFTAGEETDKDMLSR